MPVLPEAFSGVVTMNNKKGSTEMCDKRKDGEQRINESREYPVTNKQDQKPTNLSARDNPERIQSRADIVRPPARPSGTTQK